MYNIQDNKISPDNQDDKITPDNDNNAEEQKLDKDFEHLQEFLDAGVHFGHIKSFVNPKMFPYILSVFNNVHLIDVKKTEEKLQEAIKFLKKCKEENKKILFIGTKFSIRDIVKKSAEETNMFYIINYWPGGFITNWKTISGRIEYFKDLEKLVDSGEWEKYTKHERAIMNRDLDKLRDRWEGVRNMVALPDVVLIADMQEDAIAVTEAKKKGIPIVGLVDTNVDPTGIDYPIPANDDAISSVSLILGKLKDALK